MGGFPACIKKLVYPAALDQKTPLDFVGFNNELFF
tara:strand:+ start:104 stop:208 length:105 start_codon:yes stop_codon:yes gene_type:complete